MNPNILVGLVKRVYPNFDMSSFPNRLRLQKVVYLMEAFGIPLGYSFSYYIRGPYSTNLARDAFAVDNFDEVKQVKFSEESLESRLVKFLEWIDSRKNNDDLLEILASIHFLHKINPEKNDNTIVELVKNKRLELNDKEQLIKESISYLKEAQVYG